MRRPGDDSVQPSRRGLLGGISALFAGAAAATVAAEPAGGAPAPADLPPILPTAVPFETVEAQLIALSRRAEALQKERDRALEDQTPARERFYELCPKPPPDICILDPSHPGAARYGTMGKISAWTLNKDLPGFEPRSRIGRWAKKAIKLAEAFEGQCRQAKRDSGLEAAELQILNLDYELEELVKKAFAFTPQTAAGCAAQARIFLAGFDLADVSRDFRWSKSNFAFEFAPLLAESAAMLSDGGRDA